MASATATPSPAAAPSANAEPVRRVRKGMRAADLAPGGGAGRELTAVQQIDSPFQLQEYLHLLLADVANKGAASHEDVERIVRLPTSSPGGCVSSDEPAAYDGSLPAADDANDTHAVEMDVWIYEHLRRIVQDLGSSLVPALQQVCRPPQFGGAAPCAAMNAGAWMFLCAAHGDGERQCPAIDYTQHTLDAITSTLVAPRLFPSRTYIPPTSLRHFSSISRRISRIFLHAREHHRDVFDVSEAETQLYDRFYTLCKRYELTQIEGLPLPPALAQAQAQTKSARDEFDRASTFDRHAFTSHRPPPGPRGATEAVAAAAAASGAELLHTPLSHSQRSQPAAPTETGTVVGTAARTRSGSDASTSSVVPTTLGLPPTQADTEQHTAPTSTSTSDVLPEQTSQDAPAPRPLSPPRDTVPYTETNAPAAEPEGKQAPSPAPPLSATAESTVSPAQTSPPASTAVQSEPDVPDEPAELGRVSEGGTSEAA